MSAPATFDHFERELNRLVEQFGKHLAPEGMAGFVLANGSMSSNQSGEGDIVSPPSKNSDALETNPSVK